MKSVSVAALVALFCLTQLPPPAALAQQTSQQTDAQQQQQQQQDQAPPADGGPTGDNGSIAIPRKPAASTPAPLPPPPAAPKNPPGLGNLSIRVNVPVVTVDVGVILEKTHQFVPNLQEDNFRVFEDGHAQAITHFQRIQAPITAVLLVEFAANNWWFINDMENAAYSFTQQLRPDDYVAVMTYDMHTHILTDFTQNKSVVMNALNTLTIPTWNETNMFDALYTTLDRLTRVPGRKYIVLVGSGVDTFSKITLDKTLQKIKETPNVTIFSIGTGQLARMYAENRGMGMGGPREMTYLQADNQMTTFARMTGGMAFFPRFPAEMPEDFHLINNSIRNQYVLTYTPTNPKQDGTYRKIHVELVDNEGHPLRMQDEKHHQLKYDVIARDGYRAKQEVQ
ncbi:MAG TPA: VWA domain-containing protein [Acidobacteriaceae bacterium]|nr:VWA domain-containing protein [Acidobacteriaceae bacterium]